MRRDWGGLGIVFTFLVVIPWIISSGLHKDEPDATTVIVHTPPPVIVDPGPTTVEALAPWALGAALAVALAVPLSVAAVQIVKARAAVRLRALERMGGADDARQMPTL